MSDLATQRDLARRLEQTQVTERPGGVTGFDTFYQTSTYTPTYFGGTTAGATTYSFQQGKWTRIGNLIFVTGAVVWTAATGTGNACIALPVVVKLALHRALLLLVRQSWQAARLTERISSTGPVTRNYSSPLGWFPPRAGSGRNEGWVRSPCRPCRPCRRRR